jgi:predicted nucleotidyltransferase
MSEHTNIIRIQAVANAFKEMKEQVVFVGGATVSLYADRPVHDIRPTDDIDVIIEVLNYSQRQLLEERLREIGFTNDIDSGIICRFKIQGISVDIMPTDDPSIGFNNIWYPGGFEHAQNFRLLDGNIIRILTAPYFIATKLEAFKSRGGGDGRSSHDFEDIVFVLENRAALWDEIHQCDDNLKTYLKKEFTKLIENTYIHEWVDSHVERGVVMPATDSIIKNIKTWISE